MGLRKNLLALAGSIALLNLVAWGIPKIAPEVPERYEGVTVAAPHAPNLPTTTPPPLPPGFPSMDRPPPEIEVPDGEPQPIATKFGLTYDVPPDWEIWHGGVAGWYADDGASVIYGALGFYKRTKCSDDVWSEGAMTGMTGRRTLDLDAAARAEVMQAEMMFSASDETRKPTVVISGPRNFSIGDRPAVRYRATVENIPEAEQQCISQHATFDVIATPGYATAEVALFAVIADRGADDALGDAEIDEIISSLRES